MSAPTHVLFTLSNSQGEFLFRADGVAAKTISREASYRWPALDRLWNDPAVQFTGAGAETMQITAEMLPLWRDTGTRQPERLRSLARAALSQAEPEPFTLVTGTGDVLGEWVILDMEETVDPIGPGGAPLAQRVQLRLQRYTRDQA